MGMFGGGNPMAAPGQQYIPQDLLQGAPASSGGGFLSGFNKPGGLASKLGRVADFLGNSNQFSNAAQQPLDNDFRERQLAVQAQIAGQRADTEPAIVKTLRAAGIDPAGEYGRRLIAQNLAAPHYVTLGNAESGQTVIDPSQMGGAPSGPPPEAAAQLKANPASAAQFDEIFGPGASARVLGGN